MTWWTGDDNQGNKGKSKVDGNELEKLLLENITIPTDL